MDKDLVLKVIGQLYLNTVVLSQQVEEKGQETEQLRLLVEKLHKDNS